MNTLPAKELKRRGVAVIEEMISDGPLEIIKNNQPTCVVLSIEQYRELTAGRDAATSGRRKISDLFTLPPRGKRNRAEIDAELYAERENWGGR